MVLDKFLNKFLDHSFERISHARPERIQYHGKSNLLGQKERGQEQLIGYDYVVSN
jgi:hypothetical protein